MIKDAAGERSEQRHFLDNSPGSSNAGSGGPPVKIVRPPRRRQRLASRLTKRPDEDVRVGHKARALKRSP